MFIGFPLWRSIAGGFFLGLLLAAVLSGIRDWYMWRVRPEDDALLLSEELKPTEPLTEKESEHVGKL